jgi:hypothetical protein
MANFGLTVERTEDKLLSELEMRRIEDFKPFWDGLDDSFIPGTRNCKICDEEFTLNAGEVYFYWSKNLFLPKRCPLCRERKNELRRKNNE